MPVAFTSTSTSPARGPSSSSVSRVSGAPAFQATAALVFICSFLLALHRVRRDQSRFAGLVQPPRQTPEQAAELRVVVGVERRPGRAQAGRGDEAAPAEDFLADR